MIIRKRIKQTDKQRLLLAKLLIAQKRYLAGKNTVNEDMLRREMECAAKNAHRLDAIRVYDVCDITIPDLER